ncbi:MAG: cupin domain-containing protein [Planctomycetes bacterium]|nr:cupin domain-containing protein [Planctomycetota bacterium]
MEKVNLAEQFGALREYLEPRVVGELNGHYVKLIKFAGPFVWYSHENEDALYLVVKGKFRMELRDRTVDLHEGEFFIVPRGAQHRPVAEEEVHVLLVEPSTSLDASKIRPRRTTKWL